MVIPAAVRDEIVAHARAGLPNEACGILAGSGDRVERFYPAEPDEPSPFYYRIESRDQIRIMRETERAELSRRVVSAEQDERRKLSLFLHDGPLQTMRFIHDTHPAHTIILVDRIDLMNQWIAGFDYWLGLKAGQIGDGQWIDSRRVNVATVQTIWSAMKKGKDDLALLRSVFFPFYDNMLLMDTVHQR